jgi:phosphoribosylglycinamide formyltransferase-1
VTAEARPRLAVLISGRGSNLQAFLEASRRGDLAADICLVLSNNREAAGLERARAAGIPTSIIDHRDYATREAFDAALVGCIQEHAADVVLLAGFMRILTPVFTEIFQGRLLNVHPSLLPRYRGLNTHQRVLDAGDRETGVTVHFVTPALDGGPPVLQARVPVRPEDTAQTLAERVLALEHVIYPLAASWLVQGRLRLSREGAILDGELIPPTGIPYEPGLQ